MVFRAADGPGGMKKALDNLCRNAEKAIDEGANYIILSDRTVDAKNAAIPSILAVSAVHHYLVSVQKRVQTALIVETGEMREVMHAALLLGYGASAINPYMAFAVLDDLVTKKELQLDADTAEKNYVKALCKGLLKIISKMGISTIRSYRGARLFEAVGLSGELMNSYFGGTSSGAGGIGLNEIAEDAIKRHAEGFDADISGILPHEGVYSYRKDGEKHAWNPETISTLQLATKLGSYGKFKEYSRHVDEKEKPVFLRDFLGFKKRKPIPLDKVEPASEIMKRFVTGAMSFGAISKEAHEAMALAMNKIHGRSNTGEGGEDEETFFRHTGRHTDAFGYKTSRIRAFRRHGAVPGIGRRNTDKSGTGSQTGRRRPASGL